MKKHPVDDLFARKLHAWEPEPSTDVWQRIQAGQQKKQRRMGGWYWYAAANVALVLTVGYVVWKVQADDPATLGEKNLVKVQVPAHQKPATPDGHQGTETVAGETIISVPAGEGAPVYSNKGRVALTVDRARKKVPETEPVARKEHGPALNIEIAALAKEKISNPAPDVDSPELSLPATLPVGDMSKTIRPSTESRVVIAHVKVEDELDEEQKSSRLIRILRQFKNAKEGEAVNWNEVGINPKKLMARADERIRNEEEKVTKQYNALKEKLEL